MLGKALTSAFSVGILSRLVVQLCALVQIMVASRYFGLAEFGAYALAWACAVIFKTFIYTGYYQALLRSKTPEEDAPTVFGVMVCVGLMWAGFAAMMGSLIGASQPLTGQMFLALAALPLIDALAAWNEVRLLRASRMRTTTTITALAELAATLALFAALALGFGPIALVLARYAGVITQTGLSAWCVRIRPAFALRSAVLRRHWHTAFPLWVGTGTGLLTNYGADLVLGAFLNPAQVGAYRGGARIATTAVDLVQQPLTILNWSRFSRLDADGERDALPEAWRINMSFAAAVSWPVLVTVALTSREIITVIFDAAWLPAAPVISILCLVHAIRLIPSQLEPTLTSYDRQYLQLRIRLFGLCLLIVALLAAGRYGAEAAAQVQILTASIVGAISVVAIARTMRQPIAWLLRGFVPALGLSLLCGGVVLALGPLKVSLTDTAALALTFAAAAAVWVVAMALAVSRRILLLPIA